jgi:NAD(P)-dependent dehydrogenase (short-subunit alcohol dehydrogenase family)
MTSAARLRYKGDIYARRCAAMALEGKVAVVTGAGRGIGRAIAARLISDGARVVIGEYDPETGSRTAAELGERALFQRTDVNRIEDIDTLIAHTVEICSRLDVLINNAGVTKSLGFFDVTPADWDRMHAVNARGVFFCMQRAAREMTKQGSGKIINIASIAGKGYRGTSNIAYAASKGAVITMTRIAAAQLARHNINVNAICPGVTRTPMLESILRESVQRRGLDETETIRRLEATVPLGRSNAPDDIAKMAAFLASSESDNITGQSFNVDGGMWD